MIRGSRLPSLEKRGDGFRGCVLELLLAFGVEKFAVGVENSEGRNALRDGNVVLLRDVDVFIHVADIDVDKNEVFVEELGVGTLVIVDIENLAVAAPVTPKIEQDPFVFGSGTSECCGDVGCGIGCLGVEVLIWQNLCS